MTIFNHQKILVVEDDKQINTLLCFALEKEGFSYVTASTAENALDILRSQPIDIILLDLGLPDMDGIEVIRHIRTWSDIPILVVSARDQDNEKVMALDSGADDYLTKPFSMTELMARIRVALRHVNKTTQHTHQNLLSVGELQMDLDKRVVWLNNEIIHLTPLEYDLLALLFKNIGKVLTTNYINKEIYGKNYGHDTQALRALMVGLRRKIEKISAQPRYILTEIGIGYRLVDE